MKRRSPRNAQTGIDIAGLATVQLAECPRKAILVRWHGDDMDMVRHQAIGPDLDAIALRCLGQEIKVERIVALLEKRLFAPVPALGYMMRMPGKDETREASNAEMLAETRGAVNNWGISYVSP